MTIRLLMLHDVLGRDGTREAYLLWARLSDATHPHPYELAPTAAELRRWHDDVVLFVASVTCTGQSAVPEPRPCNLADRRASRIY